MTRVTTEKPVDLDQALEAALEGEIREFVRCDGASLRRTPETDSELVANNIGILFQRVAGTSVQDIDGLIAELQTLRSLLQDRGERVQRELTEYAHLSRSAIQSTKIIAESLVQPKRSAIGHRTRPRADGLQSQDLG
jgi:hypothetical protein